MTTPLTDGASLSETEISSALAMRRIYDSIRNHAEALEHLCSYGDVKLIHWQGPGSAAFKHKVHGRMIWLVEGDDEFHQAYRFAHEWHHLRFAPDLKAFQLDDWVQISKWEGKADLFASLFMMPLMESDSANQVYRFFGEELKRGAHCRLLFFQQQGW